MTAPRFHRHRDRLWAAVVLLPVIAGTAAPSAAGLPAAVVIPDAAVGAAADPSAEAPAQSPPGSDREDETRARDDRAPGEDAADTGEGAPLSDAHQRWLEEVSPILSEREREVFVGIERDYQRASFIEHFWRVRDPFPETGRNELRELWDARVEAARAEYDNLEDDRARLVLLYGEPDTADVVRCPSMLVPLEVWSYTGNVFIRGHFTLVLVRLGGRDEYRLWSPQESLYSLLAGQVRSSITEPQIAQRIGEECFRGDRLLLALDSALDWERLESPVPDPGSEWLDTFLATSTDMPAGAEAFPAHLTIRFPGRYQSRTVVQGIIEVASSELTPFEEGKESTYNLLLDGEVVLRDDLFETFRYRFQYPAGGSEEPPELPLIFERTLRPGTYTLVVRARDLSSGRFYREERELKVPLYTPPPEVAAVPDPAVAGATATATASSEDPAPAPPDALAEANASLSTGDQTIRLLAPPPELLVGVTRIEAVVRGEGIDRVRFLLDDRPVMSKRRPPFSVELQLGQAPRIHRVTAVAEDERGGEVARDEILLNAGPHRFAVRLVEPKAGASYQHSVRARAEVEVPEGEVLDRVELFLNDTRVATLYQPPFEQPVVIPAGLDIAYVRALAFLEGGTSTEDLVFVNSPQFLDKIQVDLVELYTTVLDRRGRPVTDLEESDLKVLENGVEQELRRFETVEDIPIYAGVLMDTSASMAEELDEAVRGALQFFDTVLTSKDRAAVITFAERHELAVRFTNNSEVLAGGVAGLVAEGETNLYDSLVYALYYFAGIKGKRALILLSDGEDVGSRYSFDDALDYARRTGVAIYTIGLGLSSNQREAMVNLSRLAEETGGRAFLIHRAYELGRVYKSIEDELRSQYLLAYQSSQVDKDDESFRAVEVQVSRPGLEAKTIKGYFP